MRMAATGGAIALTLASAWVLYSESTATLAFEQRLQSSERLRDRLRDDIAVLKAERAYLARPARIEPAARALGMRPALERQYVHIDDVCRALVALQSSTETGVFNIASGESLSNRRLFTLIEKYTGTPVLATDDQLTPTVPRCRR